MFMRNLAISKRNISQILIFGMFVSSLIFSPFQPAANAAPTKCIVMSVQDPYDLADFYQFTVHWKNKCSKIVKIEGEFFVKTSNGAVYGRPDPGYVSFQGGLCGVGNYFSFYENPGEEQVGNVCNSVKIGAKVVSYFMASTPVSKPSLYTNGKWTLK